MEEGVFLLWPSSPRHACHGKAMHIFPNLPPQGLSCWTWGGRPWKRKAQRLHPWSPESSQLLEAGCGRGVHMCLSLEPQGLPRGGQPLKRGCSFPGLEALEEGSHLLLHFYQMFYVQNIGFGGYISL